MEAGSVEKSGFPCFKTYFHHQTCAEGCFGGHLRGTCRSFAFMDTPNTPGECGAHKHAQVDKLIYHNCRVVSGRVGDIDKGAKREMYDSCMFLMSFDKANNNDCRVCEHDVTYMFRHISYHFSGT